MNSFITILRRGFLAVCLAALTSTAAIAHPGHGDPIAEQEAVQRATAEISRLVTSGKLEKSWKVASELQTATLQTQAENKEWALVFTNPQATDAQKRTLHVFLSETGEFLAANFTGR